MNSKERVLTTFKHVEPDRVPISDQLIVSRVASEILGRHAYTDGGEFARDSIELLLKGERDFLVNRYIEDMVELHQKLDLDFIAIQGPVPPKENTSESLPKKIAPNTYRYENKETEIFNIARFDESSGLFFSIDSSYKREGIKAVEKEVDSMRKELEDGFVLDETTLEGLEGIINRVKGERAIGFSAGVGIPPETHWLEGALLKPEWVELYLDYQLRKAMVKIEEGAKIGVDFFLSECDIADNRGPIYSPAIFKKMIVPRCKKLVDLAHSYGCYYIYRTDGNTRPLWKMLFDEIGVDGYMEIDVGAGMDLGEMKEAYGDKITLLGNVDCAKTLIYGTKEEIFAEVKACIQKAAKDGGYILTSSNSIHYNIPAKNFLYMVEAGKKFGSYPISE